MSFSYDRPFPPGGGGLDKNTGEKTCPELASRPEGNVVPLDASWCGNGVTHRDCIKALKRLYLDLV